MLPFADRVAVARDRLARRPEDPEMLALPYAEVRDTLLALTRSHRAGQREAGWLALLRSAMLDPDGAAFADAIGRAGRAWTDQHEVQRKVLDRLAAAPARNVDAVPVPLVAAVVHATLTRPDGAPRSRQHLDDWLGRTLAVALAAANRPDAGAATVDRAAEVFRQYARTVRGLGRWHDAPCLRPPVRAAVSCLAGRRDLDDRTLLGVAAQLGPDLDALPGLRDRLHGIVLRGADAESVREAARLWVGGAPADRAERLRALLPHDPALAREPEIARLLTTRHTDLLDLPEVRSLRPLVPATPAALRAWRPAQRRWFRQAFADLLDPTAPPPDLALWDHLLAATADRPHRIDPYTWRALHDHADPTRFPAVLTHLERHTGLTATLLWLRLATIQGTWTALQLHRLDTLRHHPDPDIREAAHDVRPAPR
ncbi:hypothetical protein [Dactylosporangium sp. NPDC050588]|uniref:hypothetical protein n=1 Tax=Dactylosporangium sp. NPDC050588 TaxID=3157211 RepID=UPI0033C6D41E